MVADADTMLAKSADADRGWRAVDPAWTGKIARATALREHGRIQAACGVFIARAAA